VFCVGDGLLIYQTVNELGDHGDDLVERVLLLELELDKAGHIGPEVGFL
jgi:hypothetical protein